MNQKGIKRIIVLGLCFLIAMMLTATAFAQEAEPGGTAVQKDMRISTEVRVGRSADGMFPLESNADDPNDQPLSDVFVEHCDFYRQENVDAGLINAQDMWKTRISAESFNQVIIGEEHDINIADIWFLRMKNKEFKRRLFEDGWSESIILPTISCKGMMEENCCYRADCTQNIEGKKHTGKCEIGGKSE